MKTKVLSAWESIRTSLWFAPTLMLAIAVTTRTEAQRQVLRRHVETIYRAGHEALTEKKDRDDLEERFRGVMEKVGVRV